MVETVVEVAALASSVAEEEDRAEVVAAEAG